MIEKQELLTEILQTKNRIISEKEEPRGLCEKEMNKLADKVKEDYNIRKELVKFVDEMESVLKDNDYKGGWDDCSIEFIRNKLIEEFREVLLESGKLITGDTSEKNIKKTQKESVDLANICMILFDKLESCSKGS